MCTGEVRRVLISQGTARQCMAMRRSQQLNTTWGWYSVCVFVASLTWPDCNVKPEIMQEDVDLILCDLIGS